MKSWKKRGMALIGGLLTAALLFGVSACGSSTPKTAGTSTSPEPTVESVAPATPTPTEAPTPTPTPEPTPEPTPTPAPKKEYIKTDYYTLTIPEVWQGKYSYTERTGEDIFDPVVHELSFDAGLFTSTLVNNPQEEYLREWPGSDPIVLGALADISMMEYGRPSFYVGEVVISVISDPSDLAEAHPELYDALDTIFDSFEPAEGYALMDT